MNGWSISHGRDINLFFFFTTWRTAYICIAVRFIVCTLFAQASGEKNAVPFTVRRKAIRLTGTLTGRHGCRDLYVDSLSFFFFFFATYNFFFFRKSVRFKYFGFFKSYNEYSLKEGWKNIFHKFLILGLILIFSR